MALLQRSGALCRELGNKDGLQMSLGDQALILQARGDLDGAMALHKEAGATLPRARQQGGAASVARQPGGDPQARGDLDGAMALLKEQERLCRELGNKRGCKPRLAARR